jgi:hypothetical protein
MFITLLRHLSAYTNIYCDAKPLITNKCTKRVSSSIVTHSYMFRPCWVIFRENFFVIVTPRLHFTVEWECAVDCVLRCFWRRELSGLEARTTDSSCLQCTVNSTFSLNYKVQPQCNDSKNSAWRWPSRVETCRSVLQLMIKLSLCICWWLVFLYNTVHGHGTHQTYTAVFGPLWIVYLYDLPCSLRSHLLHKLHGKSYRMAQTCRNM